MQTGTPARAAAKPDGREATVRRVRKPLILFTMCLAVLIAQLDTSVVTLALKPIDAELRMGIAGLQWVIDAYNLVYASLLLTGGTLGDLYGRRRIFILGVGIFTLGSLICGLAPGETMLIAGRAVTGLGAASMLPTSLAILAITYADGKERAQAIGVWASCNGLAFSVGPTIGGWIVEVFGWRGIFLLIVPVSALALGMALALLAESAHPEGRRLDPSGQVLAIAALGSLTLAAIEGPHWGWTASLTAGCIGLGVASAIVLIGVERRSEGALVPLDLFGRGALASAMAVAALMTFGMYAMLFLMPLYFQSLRGASVVMAGLQLFPMSLTFLMLSQFSGWLSVRFGARGVMTAGMALMGAGLLLLASVSPATSLYAIQAYLIAIGLGLGLNAGPVVAVAVASVPPARSGTASGLVNTARIVGATLGIAVLGSLFAVHVGAGGREGFIAGMRAAFLLGGAGELLGAWIAWLCTPHDSLERKPG